MHKYYKAFIFITITSFILLIYITYNTNHFQNNPLPKNILQEIKEKENHIKYLVKRYYGINVNIPIVIDDNIHSSLYGYATYKNGIKIHLNKKRFEETKDYMINDVLPHEYAHAMMFVFGDLTDENGGHTKKWQKICIALDGIKCKRYVNRQDILEEKVRF